MTAEFQLDLPLKDLVQPQPVAWIMIVRTDPQISILGSERIDDGSLTFPGGKVETNEQPIFAAIRELIEETGLKIKPDEVFTAGTSQVMATVDRTHIKAHSFFAFWGSVSEQIIQIPEPNKHTDWKWFSFSEIANSIINGRLPANFDLQFFVNLSELIFESTYEDNINYSTSHILSEDHEYVYWSKLEQFQQNLFGKALDFIDN